MTSFETQRLNMLESQVRTSDVTDRRILRAMGEIQREAFLPSSLKPLAYSELGLRLDAGEVPGGTRTMLSPMVFSRLVQLAAIEAGDLVLDLGCVSGYSTAVIARLAESVVGIEEDRGLVDRATAALAEQGTVNAAVITGALIDGQAGQGPFDAIVVEGRVSNVPERLLRQLKDGGRLVAIEGEAALGGAVVWTRIGDGFGHRKAFDAAAVMLPGFARADAFVF